MDKCWTLPNIRLFSFSSQLIDINTSIDVILSQDSIPEPHDGKCSRIHRWTMASASYVIQSNPFIMSSFLPTTIATGFGYKLSI